MKQCFAVKERHPVIPDRVVHLAASYQEAHRVSTVKNGDSIKLDKPNRFYVGIARMN
jgi:hypothetical protein